MSSHKNNQGWEEKVSFEVDWHPNRVDCPVFQQTHSPTGSQEFFTPGQTFPPQLGGLPGFAGSLSNGKVSCEMTGTSCFLSHPRLRHCHLSLGIRPVAP